MFEQYTPIVDLESCKDSHLFSNQTPRIVYKCEYLPKVPYHTISDSNDVTLIFESRFESGNLKLAVQMY
jgi:hypothetical protein